MCKLAKSLHSKQVDHLMNEKETLELLGGQPYFPRLLATFLTASSACFALEYVEGVSLFQYQRAELCLPIQTVQYCAASALLMLENLHRQEVVYRDLKPENVVVGRSTGKLTLIDFGFAKQISGQGRTFTKCGTPGYSAPEVLQQPDANDFYS